MTEEEHIIAICLATGVLMRHTSSVRGPVLYRKKKYGVHHLGCDVKVGCLHVVMKVQTHPICVLTASISASIAVSDTSRISCIRRTSYRCTICRRKQDLLYLVAYRNIKTAVAIAIRLLAVHKLLIKSTSL